MENNYNKICALDLWTQAVHAYNVGELVSWERNLPPAEKKLLKTNQWLVENYPPLKRLFLEEQEQLQIEADFYSAHGMING